MEMVSSKSLRSLGEFDDHLKVFRLERRDVGLDGFIAIHRTKNGLAIGGTRFASYPSREDALRDALRLSRAMTYKCALANVPLGGGKGVIMLPSRAFDRKALIAAYADFLNEVLGFYTGEDVGITQEDVAVMAEHSPYIVGKPGLAGDPGPWAALSVHHAIRAALGEVYGKEEIRGRSFAIKGLGKVGVGVARLLSGDGGIIFGADTDPAAVRRAQKEVPGIRIVSPETVHALAVDVYVPCALGRELDGKRIRELKCRIVCGGANNQLASPDADRLLAERGIWYVPDYVANAGGLLNVAAELDPDGYREERVRARVEGIATTVRQIFRLSRERGETPGRVSNSLAEAFFVPEEKETLEGEVSPSGEGSPNYAAWELRTEDFSRCVSEHERLLFLVRFAILAPSSHNSQPWYFVIRDSDILLKPDFSRMLPVSDPLNRHLYFALGCALENLLVAADYYGMAASVTYFPNEDTVAAIRFSGEAKPKGNPREHLIFQIPMRRMNRGAYELRPPDPVFLENLKNFPFPAVRFTLAEDRARKNILADLMLEFRFGVFENPSFRTELSSYKRTNLTRSFLGMPGFTMGFSTIFSLFAPWFIRHFNVMRFIRKEDERILKEQTPVLGAVTTKSNEKLDWLQSGQAAERMMLEAGKCGLAVAASALPQSEEFREALETPFYPQLFFRLGYAAATPGHSPRLPVEKVSTTLL